MPNKSNPRTANGNARRKIRAWVLATQDRCAICGMPVDKTLKTPHPMSAEVDEVIPVSLGGSPISRDNVQLAHRCCNQKKSNKVYAKVDVQRGETFSTSREW